MTNNIKFDLNFITDNFNRLEDYQVTTQPLYTIGYAPNGNISFKADAGNYTYSPTQPNAVEEITNGPGNIPGTVQDIGYTRFNKIESISEGEYDLTVTYGPDNLRRKSVLNFQGNPHRRITYVGNHEIIEDLVNSNTYEVDYI